MAESDSERREPARDAEPAPRDLPTSLVPRWLAWLVLVALLAAAAISTWMILSQPAGGGPSEAERGSGNASAGAAAPASAHQAPRRLIPTAA